MQILYCLIQTVKRVISAETHHMNVDYNPFEGWEVTGEAQSVLVRGQYVVKDKNLLVR